MIHKSINHLFFSVSFLLHFSFFSVFFFIFLKHSFAKLRMMRRKKDEDEGGGGGGYYY